MSLHTAHWPRFLVLLAVCSHGCDTAVPDVGEPELGPIEDMLDEVSMTVWPGVVKDDGVRELRRINGFNNGDPTGYWFANFASKNAPDIFWFCREGDTLCPFDERGVIDRSRTVGNPVVSSIPGESTYSPFWLSWRVTVPDDYEADEVKSVDAVEAGVKEGRFSVEKVVFDHGGELGPADTIMHCLLVLTGTLLEGNGEDLVGQPGKPSMEIPVQEGWFRQYRVQFYDFTFSEGVFAPDKASESTPKMRSADIFVFFRDCANGSPTEVCQYAASSADLGAVSERGVEQDFTGDGDKGDTNNIISAIPRKIPDDPLDKPYSALWKVNRVAIPPENDDRLQLIDLTLDQDTSAIKSTQVMREYVAAGLVAEPKPISEEDVGNSIPGNDGEVFFNCPSQVEDE